MLAIKKGLFILILGIALMHLSGCGNAAERAGGNVGNALESAGEEIDQAAGNIKKAID